MTFVLKEASSQLVNVFAIIAVGYLLGRIRIKGIGLGTAAIFISGLIFGHFGVQTPAILQTLGLILFISSVGLSAGPSFVQRLRANGLSYVILCLTVALSGALVCAAIILIGGIDSPLAVGMMTGAYTTSPGFAAAKEAVAADPNAVSNVAAGYGIIYPIGVVGKVLFIQLVPKLLHADMETERRLIAVQPKAADSSAQKKMFKIEPLGLFSFALTIIFGILVGSIVIPLPGGTGFSLGAAGGPLIAGLLIGHFGRIGRIDLTPDSRLNAPAKEIGLVLFFSGAGVEGGRNLAEILKNYGFTLILYGLALVAIPLFVGYIMFRKVLKLPLLNGLGSMTASMTCTPSLAVLIQTAGTDDVAVAYATTYPVALIVLILLVQLLVGL